MPTKKIKPPKSSSVQTSSSKKYWLGFDLGGTKMLAVVFDENLKIVGEDRRKTKGHEGSAAGWKRVQKTIDNALEQAMIKPSALSGIGIGLPGILDLNQGLLHHAPNLGWRNVPVRTLLEKTYQCSAFTLNDVDAGTYGEYRLGAGKGARCILGVFPGTGVGAGCIYQGLLIRGRKVSCMEIGAMKFLGLSLHEKMNNPITLEAYTGRLAIAAASAEAALRGNAPRLLRAAGSDIANIRSKALVDAIRGGDRAIKRIFQTSIDFLGLGIANAVNLLAPDSVVIGGGLVEAAPELYIQGVEQSLRKHALPEIFQDLTVKAAKLGDHAVAIGAALYAKDQVLQPS